VALGNLTISRRMSPSSRSLVVIRELYGRAVHGAVRIWVDLVRDKSVFTNKVGNHIPLATIADGAFQQFLNKTAFKVFRRSFNSLFEEEVGLLEFISVEEVCLREFEFVQIMFLHYNAPEDVRGGEEPASS
jgi:hypothetical protein